MEVKWSENPFEPSVNVNVHTPSPLKVPEYSAGQFPSHFTFNLLYPCFHCVTLVVLSKCVEQQDLNNGKGVVAIYLPPLYYYSTQLLHSPIILYLSYLTGLLVSTPDTHAYSLAFEPSFSLT